MKKLALEINSQALVDHQPLAAAGVVVTPAINEDFWLMRVRLSEQQAIVIFPKFFTIGCGFQVEEDWNTNLPIGTDAEAIYNHIRHNKGDAKITKAKCLEAIRMLQAAVSKMQAEKGVAKLKAAEQTQDLLEVLQIAESYIRDIGHFDFANILYQKHIAPTLQAKQQAAEATPEGSARG